MRTTSPWFACSFAVCLLLSSGCASLQSPPEGGPSPAAARVARLAGVAANLGTRAYLLAHPDRRPAFVLAHGALSALIDVGNWDPAEFAAALQGLGVRELKGEQGALYISVAVVVWDEFLAMGHALDRQEMVKATMVAVRDGLGRGLE